MIKIFSFIKDEIDIIEDWIKYHSNIIGESNIHIVDHGSTDGTLSILKKFKINLYHTNEPFGNKSKILSRIMNSQKGFLIPLDADEFLVIKNANNLSSDSTQISDYIKKLPHKKSLRYKFHQIDAIPSKTKLNDPLLQITEFKSKWYKDWKLYAKTFYHSDFFISTDQGNHKGSVKGEGSIFETDLVIVHYDVRDYDHFVKKMTRGAKAYGHHQSKIITHGKGKHYHRRYWAIIEGKGLQQMIKEFGDVGNFKSTVIGDKIKELR